MQKTGVLFIIAVVCMMTFATFVDAVGTSTRRTTTNTSATDTVPVRCDTQTQTRDRIKCRLEKRTEAETDAITEESCEGLSAERQATCRRLYLESDSCYDLPNTRKVACLRERTQYTQESTNEQRRNYLVLLLYELQERVEIRFESGKLTSEQAASIIDQILVTKQAILKGESRVTIKAEIQELRVLWSSQA